MRLSPDQWGVVRGSGLALAFSAGVAAVGYAWLPPELFGLEQSMTTADRIAFALRADLFLFVWLAGCVGAVSRGRFHSPADVRGSAFGPQSPAIAVRIAVLQNSLEQTVLALGAHLILATVLRDRELVLIPLLVLLFWVGRVAFAAGYSRGAPGRAFGMAVTGAPIVASYLLAAGLVLAGR
jgi:hypothetical protein